MEGGAWGRDCFDTAQLMVRARSACRHAGTPTLQTHVANDIHSPIIIIKPTVSRRPASKIVFP